jgi:transcriptional regulator with XRE-family HTH domain
MFEGSGVLMADKELPLLARRLTALRERRGVSQQELAIRSGLSLSQISHIEQGRVPDPRGSTISALAKALEVSCADLMEEKPRPKRRKRDG